MSGLAGMDLTVPGGMKLFFTPVGGVERDLGNIVGDSASINRDTEELEHFTNRSGKRRQDKLIPVEESVQIDFEIDEINIENMRYFFKGGAVEDVNPGTDSVTDQKVTLPGEKFISVGNPGISSVTARQFVDHVFLFDGSDFEDHSAEADTAAGTPFAINADDDDVLYIGKRTPFAQLGIDVNVASVGYTNPLWEYWDGNAWQTLALASGDGDFESDETITWNVPGDWAQTTVNGELAYWIRFSQDAAAPATPATINSLGRAALVENTSYAVDSGEAQGIGNTRSGAVKRIATGVLVDGEEIKVSYSYVTFQAQKFGVAETTVLEGSARFENYPSEGRGRRWDLTIPRCVLTNNGAMDLDDTDWQTIPLSLVILDNYDNDPEHPFGTVTVYPHS